MNSKSEIEKIKSCINDLVYDKVQLRKAYNYYHCKRDAEQFKALEENYGIGTPTSVSFTPLIKKHIDVLVGEYLELDPDLQVSCKDENTVHDIMRDKQLKIHSEAFNYFKQHLENAIISALVENKQAVQDPFFQKEIDKIKKTVDRSYVSEYETAAQNILNFIKNSRDIDLKNKMRELFTDLLVSGLCYYRVKPSGSGSNLELEILNPIDTFIERNRNSFYLNRSPRAVIRKWMTKEQVLINYGEELSSNARSKLNEIEGKSGSGGYYIQTGKEVRSVYHSENILRQSTGILGGMEAIPTTLWNTGESYSSKPLIEVYECEWIEVDSDNTAVRHEGVRIGTEIYICRGESKNIIRSLSNPKDCTLSVNGMFFMDKNGSPFSMILSTMDLQDRYDLLLYYRDNLIATSGTVGDWVDMAHLPEVLGEEFTERFSKWQAYKKNGVAWFDSSQEGAGMLNTTFNGFDDTIKADSIQAIQIAIESVEMQASSITGVFAEKLGGIQQRDAVSNVKVGIRQSTLLTKQYFSAMDLMYKEVNYDLLNLAKIVYKNGISGTLILGNRLAKMFTALPEYYTMTDFDIHIQDSTEILQVKETMRGASIELIKSGQADPNMIINIASAKNITDLKNYIEEAVETRKQENDMISKLQKALEDAQQQLKQLEGKAKELDEHNQKLQKEIENNNRAKLELEQRRIINEELERKDKKDYNDKQIEVKEKQLQVEWAQINDGNPYNDKIRN